ncbi:hypothetical protein KP509_13G023900 [Ceratopteris richardii]|uniref:Uncharacterized protein n=1 Tax=Ceratopteris richardii TaxID=49495 RepID=A0A8T2TC67_CERRI|nr:hypothetical protein KP509_13G023900 [Ceratopteris richardii]
MAFKGVDKFAGTNFHTWQMKTKGFLMRKGVWSFPNKAPPTERELEELTQAAKTQHKLSEERAYGIIITVLDETYINYVDEAKMHMKQKMHMKLGKHWRIFLVPMQSITK